MSFLSTVGGLLKGLVGGTAEKAGELYEPQEDQYGNPIYRSTIKAPDLNNDENYAKALKYNKISSRAELNRALEYQDQLQPLLTSSYAKKKLTDAQADKLKGYNDLAYNAGTNYKYWD